MQELNFAEVAHVAGGLFHVVDDSQSYVSRDIKPEN
jgi:hypothetical protein